MDHNLTSIEELKKFYQQHKSKLLPQHEGQWVVIKNFEFKFGKSALDALQQINDDCCYCTRILSSEQSRHIAQIYTF